MDIKLKTLIASVERIEQKLEKSTPSLLSQVLLLAEKILLPVTAIVLGCLFNNATIETSKGQLALAKMAGEDKRIEVSRVTQAKYIELFLNDLNSGSQKRQLNAIRLVEIVEPEIAQKLLTLVPETPNVSKAVVEKAKEVKAQILRKQYLDKYTIGIYYTENDFRSEKIVSDIQSILAAAGLLHQVKIYSCDNSTFKRLNPPTKLEVRYEPQTEEGVANSLISVLNSNTSNYHFTKTIVATKTPYFISIFVPFK